MRIVHTDSRSATRRHGGFVIGELLVALLLLAVAVSSLAALMYSVSRRPEEREPVACVAKGGAAPGNCASRSSMVGGASKLLRSGCAAKAGALVRGCNDSLLGVDSSDEMIIRSRTDSAALALLAKKQEAERARQRTDRGFIR